METIKVYIGNIESINAYTQDFTREVKNESQ